MKKRVYFYISVVILIALMFAAFGCSPKLERQEKRAKRKYFKALKLYPALIDSTSKTDTVTTVDTFTIRSTHYITNTVLDSILAPCDPDTVIRWKIKRDIQERCTHESLMGGKAQIFRTTNGTAVLKALGNDLQLMIEDRQIRTETTVYIPNEKCEMQCEEDKQQLKKDHRYQMLKWCLICVVIGYVLNWVVRVILRSGGLR